MPGLNWVGGLLFETDSTSRDGDLHGQELCINELLAGFTQYQGITIDYTSVR